MNDESEFTSLEVSQNLQELDFFTITDHHWSKGLWGDGKDEWKLIAENFPGIHKKSFITAPAYRADILQRWLLTEPPKVKRASSVLIEYLGNRQNNVEKAWRVTITGISGLHVCFGKTQSDAVAAAVATTWELMHPLQTKKDRDGKIR
jgi:hypothetical protein